MKDAKTLLLEGLEILRKNDEDIEDIFARHQTDCPAPCREIISLLTCYIDEIELFNPAYGLVGVNDTNELVIKHILDSLAPLGIIWRITRAFDMRRREKNEAQGLEMADAGSGAGLPGIPLAIALPQCNFTLIERMGRRAGFLLNTKAALALSNINIEENELETTRASRFDLITFRAFKPLEPKLLKTLFKACTPGGIIAAYKGKLEKIKAEMTLLQKPELEWEAIPYTVPFLDEERHLLVIKAENYAHSSS
jgi:16S rRNA (guanine527-N7)-methyltransferase